MRLTAAFALAMLLVLGAAAVFVYLRLDAGLTESLDNGLEARAAAVARSGDAAAGEPEEAEEGFAQLFSSAGGLVSSAGGVSGPALDAGQLQDVSAGAELNFERSYEGIADGARVLARPTPDGGAVAVGQSLEDRGETLAGVVASFLIGGPVAVLIASLLGYALSAAGLRPVEAMRRRAGEISLSAEDERLPLPEAHDEIRRLGLTLNEMLARMRESFARERQFVADASHELRTPLSVLKAELEGTLRAGGLPPDARESMVASLEETEGLALLADDLLLLARSADGALPLATEPTELDELLAQAARRFEDRARERGRAIVVDAPPGLEAQVDPLRMRQALGNLVDNALRHGSGTITLAARSLPGSVQIEVADEGPGFPPELAPHAFERFTRGDGARTRGGAGLGLAIVSAIASAHGGEATLGEGAPTTVRLTLPGVSPPRS